MAESILDEFGQGFRVDLVPSRGGALEVDVDGEAMFSKEDLGRHADYEADVAPALRSLAEEDPAPS